VKRRSKGMNKRNSFLQTQNRIHRNRLRKKNMRNGEKEVEVLKGKEEKEKTVE
jgi:hypothetical protein